MHPNRPHVVATVESAEALAEKLTEHTWTLCAGFRLGDLVLLNDSTSEDGASEWAIFRDPKPCVPAIQIESITFGWMTSATALECLRRLQGGRLCTPMGSFMLWLDHPVDCAYCA